MRLIGTLSEAEASKQFSFFLLHQGVEHECDAITSKETGEILYQIWVYDDDDLPRASAWLEEFINGKDRSIFAVKDSALPMSLPSTFHERREQERREHYRRTQERRKRRLSVYQGRNRQSLGRWTMLIVALCACLFIFDEPPIGKELPGTPSSFSPEVTLFSSPIRTAFLYDYPKHFELMNRLIQLNRSGHGMDDTSQEAWKLLESQAKATPFWPGLLATWLSGPESPPPPLFEKIREGQLWRIVTPAFLHASFFHILFNVLWVVLLGSQIEFRLGVLRYLLLVGLLAAFSNTCQYLMSGFPFLGISGVVMGMAGFIWSRQKKAPWEGYRLNSATFFFLVIFVVGIAFLQGFSLLFSSHYDLHLYLGVANTAHISGLLSGMLLARIPLFSASS